MLIEGTIKRLVVDKGFGFIGARDDGNEYFFHRSDVTGVAFEDLRQGQPVTFEEVASPKGPRASKVRVA
jgi:CspA family cold shock protein